MRWENHYNSRTPKRKKKRLEKNDKNSKAESLQGILWNVIQKVDNKEGIDGGRSRRR